MGEVPLWPPTPWLSLIIPDTRTISHKPSQNATSLRALRAPKGARVWFAQGRCIHLGPSCTLSALIPTPQHPDYLAGQRCGRGVKKALGAGTLIITPDIDCLCARYLLSLYIYLLYLCMYLLSLYRYLLSLYRYLLSLYTLYLPGQRRGGGAEEDLGAGTLIIKPAIDCLCARYWLYLYIYLLFVYRYLLSIYVQGKDVVVEPKRPSVPGQ